MNTLILWPGVLLLVVAGLPAAAHLTTDTQLTPSAWETRAPAHTTTLTQTDRLTVTLTSTVVCGTSSQVVPVTTFVEIPKTVMVKPVQNSTCTRSSLLRIIIGAKPIPTAIHVNCRPCDVCSTLVDIDTCECANVFSCGHLP